MQNRAGQNVVEVREVCTRFGEHIVHAGVNLTVGKAEIFALIGGSGSGKSTLLNEMIMLQRPDSGSIQVLGEKLNNLSAQQTMDLRKRYGVMFQHGGLFGSLTVRENIGLPMREHTDLADALIDEIADWKLTMTGLKSAVGMQYPAELSGGMLKRASLARALVLDPELLFLDEPTTGLDPESAAEIDEVVCRLRNQNGLTIVMVTHDLDMLWQVTNRVAVLANGKVQAMGTMQELSTSDNAEIKKFFDGPRGRAAQDQAGRHNVAPDNGRNPSKPK